MRKDIGHLIKNLRKEKKLTLKDVSNSSGLSISFLSQVERSHSSVTLHSLRKISEALNVSPSYFFPDTIQKDHDIIRRGGRHDQIANKSSFVYSDLSGNIENPIFVPTIVTLFPGDKRKTPFTHKGEEFIYVIEGTLTILLDQVEYDLLADDSIHMSSKQPHNWFNKTNQLTKFIFVTTNDSL
ncbi:MULTISPECIES: helix-turn-helix domain-containing protein [Staphylococcus]|uniref:helix-turn-helix domain-containing protein n=1 Tax=Staphylococcus TaxID=1279 RepID=UPI000D1C7C1F|nr:XRE family transcriptional regulator [Staphylococcus gallinarum]PTE74897.1 DNA-binding protein [Staphylococcus gallinarum]